MPKESTINVILFGIIAMLAIILPACCSYQQPQIVMPVGATFKYHQYHNFY